MISLAKHDLVFQGRAGSSQTCKASFLVNIISSAVNPIIVIKLLKVTLSYYT